MQDHLSKRVLRTLTDQRIGDQPMGLRRMIRAGDRVGVAVSGGADSVALLRLLVELRGKLGIALAVLHFNHQLRGAESDADERFVAGLASEHGIELFVDRADVAEVARERGWNLEDAARRLRYSFFSSVVRAGSVQRVAVAHTADDQAETVLARLVRGTGPAGLAAIYPVKDHVVRPLLDIRRGELRDYLERLGQPWREDLSNLDTTRLRARLRHQILPVLERGLQPAIVSHLCRLAEMARQDEAFWSALAAERVHTLVRREGRRRGIRSSDLLSPLRSLMVAPVGATDLNDQMGDEAQLALARRLVRAMVGDLRGHCRGLTAQHVDQVLHLATKNASGHRTELPGIVAERNFDWIWLEDAAPGLAAAEKPSAALADGDESVRGRVKRVAFSHSFRLGTAGKSTWVTVPEIGRRFHLKVIDWSVPGVETRVEQGALDRGLLRSPLVLRNWRPGDAFRPRGHRHIRKMKRFLLEKRVALRDRAGWPVLTSGGELVWARGLPAATDFAARKGTLVGVVVAEEQI